MTSAANEAEHPPQADCEHDWIIRLFEEKPYIVRVCGWCGLAQARNSENEPWEFFTQIHGDSLRARPPFPPASPNESNVRTAAAATLLDLDYKAEKFYDGWSWEPGSSDFEPRQGITVRWRRKGERRWNKQSIYCDPEQGQTPDSLAEQLPAIVAALVRRAA